LPAAKEAVAEARTPEPSARDKERFSGTVLVVDDEATVRAVAERGLQSMGMEVVLAEDGREGLKKFRENPDLFVATLLYLTMPYADGVEVYGEIRKQRPEMPVLLMSGFNEQDAIDQFTEAEIGGFLQKPFDIEELRAMMMRLLTQSR